MHKTDRSSLDDLDGISPGDLVGEPRNVVIIATPEVSALEVAGPAEVFRLVGLKLKEAGRGRARPYKVHLLSTDAGPVNHVGVGLPVQVSGSWHGFKLPIDTLLVVGGLEVWTGSNKPGLLAWIQEAAASARRYGSICTGAFVLAQAGLLDGHRVTTHWYFCERLAREFPALTVDAEPIFIQEGRVWTAAGVTAGLDLTLSMVEQDLGLDIALRIARALVLYVRRPGWQSQFSSALALQGSTRLSFRDLPFWILENLARPLTAENLADRSSMSVRHFSRRFVEEFGTTLARFVTTLRAETARRLLEDSDRSRQAVAEECGFGSVDTMERALMRSSNRPRV